MTKSANVSKADKEYNSTCASYPGRSSQRVKSLTTLSGLELSFTGSTWSGFEMEHAFWTALENICETDQLSMQDFVSRARQRYSRLPIEAAVRIAIAVRVGGVRLRA